jgi:hypothetical protein
MFKCPVASEGRQGRRQGPPANGIGTCAIVLLHFTTLRKPRSCPHSGGRIFTFHTPRTQLPQLSQAWRHHSTLPLPSPAPSAFSIHRRKFSTWYMTSVGRAWNLRRKDQKISQRNYSILLSFEHTMTSTNARHKVVFRTGLGLA